MKICANCKHCEVHEIIEGLQTRYTRYRCQNPEILTDKVSGEKSVSLDCYDARSVITGRCGEEARYYEPKEENT